MLFSWAVLMAALWGMGPWFKVSAQGAPQQVKFDARLRATMKNPAALRVAGRLIGMRGGATPRSMVTVLVKVTDKGEELTSWLASHNGRVTSPIPPIVSVRLPWDELASMGELSTVRYVESCPPLQPAMDVAIGSTGVNVQALRAASPRFTGKGVLIGIIDSGLDTTNPAFCDASGHSRVAYMWDSMVAGPGPSVTMPDGTTFAPGYGREYSSTDLDNDPTLGLDTSGHGTHVAGIAGGRDDTYPGVAPEAQFLIVRTDFSNSEEAYAYLMARALSLNLPLVINLSAGSCTGPHDGSTLAEQSLQAWINDPTLHLLTCISSGNAQADNKHVQDSIPASGSSLVAAGVQQTVTGAPHALDIWYAAGAQPNLRLTQRDLITGTVLGTATVSYGQTTGAVNFLDGGSAPTGATVQATQSLPGQTQNGDAEILLLFTLPNSPDSAIFTVELQNTVATASRVDYYLPNDNTALGTASIFFNAARVPDVTQGPTPTGTVGQPGTTPGAITVGAYATKNSWTDANGNLQSHPDWTLGALAYFSSIGPVRNTARYSGYNISKPDIAGPGMIIASQRSVGGAYADPTFLLDNTHVMMMGTSMSCPAVTGVVALMLQENPTLTSSQVKEKLFQYARQDAYTTTTIPNPNFGYGKVDAEACNHIVSPAPVLRDAQPQSGSSTWVLRGRNFAASAQVLVNDVLLREADVTWNNHTSITIKMDSNLASIYTITVRNQYAPQGQMDSTLTLQQRSFYESTGNTSTGGSKGGCFIATAAYGSYLDPHVMVLRSFRDRWLLTNRPGAAFVDFYYRVSPPLAQVIADSPTLRVGTRLALTPIIIGIEYPVAGVAMLVVLIAAPLAWRARRRTRQATAIAA